jgi:hypothetical protein
MKERYKLLDCDRKAIFGLPPGALKLWLCYFMHESDAQESYLSLRALETTTGMARNTIIKWRDYLIDNGWLVKLGASAAERYSRPTNGSWKVPVVRVDDPSKHDIEDKSSAIYDAMQRMNHPKIAHKVSASDSAFAFALDSASSSESESGCGRAPVASLQGPLPAGEKTRKPKTTRTSFPSAVPIPAARKKIKAAQDGTPYPPDFDDWSNVERCCWLEERKVSVN